MIGTYLLLLAWSCFLAKEHRAITGDQLTHELTKHTFHKVLSHCPIYSQYLGDWGTYGHYLGALFLGLIVILGLFYEHINRFKNSSASLHDDIQAVLFRPRAGLLDKSREWSFCLMVFYVGTKCAATRAHGLWHTSRWGHRNELCVSLLICGMFSPRWRQAPARICRLAFLVFVGFLIS